ncbi:hypothetical protein CF336_g8865, partial [Tilletia laevis]
MGTRDFPFEPKPWQVEAVYRLLGGMDGVVAAGTGSGKSMIWVFASLLLRLPKANFLVITGLKEIQLEQTNILHELGISAVALNADTLGAECPRRRLIHGRGSKERAFNPIREIENNTAQVVFLSPEVLFHNTRVGKAVSESIWARDLRAVVVDEAHLVYDWGIASGSGRAAFRPEFGKLGLLRAKLNANVPLLAMSATLSGPSLPSICSALQFGRLPFFALDVGKERDGCTYDIQPFRHAASSFHDLLTILQPRDGSNVLPKTIIYVNSRSKATMAAELLRQHLPESLRDQVASFTAMDSAYEKRKTMAGLRSGSIRVVFATEALGMGIDLPDVDMIIQWELPKDFRGLVQHFGRGARGPGSRAAALLLCPDWVERCRNFYKARRAHEASPESAPPASSLTPHLQQQWSNLDTQLTTWLSTPGCLRVAITDLLRLDFKPVIQTVEPHNPTPPSVSTESIGDGPIEDTLSSFYWRRTPSAGYTTDLGTMEGTNPTCCFQCHDSNTVERLPIDVGVSTAVGRLTAPP